jgi:hypothetical protein
MVNAEAHLRAAQVSVWGKARGCVDCHRDTRRSHGVFRCRVLVDADALTEGSTDMNDSTNGTQAPPPTLSDAIQAHAQALLKANAMPNGMMAGTSRAAQSIQTRGNWGQALVDNLNRNVLANVPTS